MNIVPSLSASSHGGEVNLHGFGSLTYAPKQHGEGIRLASNGRSAEEVMSLIEQLKFDKACEDAAKTLKVTIDELFDVIRYDREHPLRSRPGPAAGSGSPSDRPTP